MGKKRVAIVESSGSAVQHVQHQRLQSWMSAIHKIQKSYPKAPFKPMPIWRRSFPCECGWVNKKNGFHPWPGFDNVPHGAVIKCGFGLEGRSHFGIFDKETYAVIEFTGRRKNGSQVKAGIKWALEPGRQLCEVQSTPVKTFLGSGGVCMQAYDWGSGRQMTQAIDYARSLIGAKPDYDVITFNCESLVDALMVACPLEPGLARTLQGEEFSLINMISGRVQMTVTVVNYSGHTVEVGHRWLESGDLDLSKDATIDDDTFMAFDFWNDRPVVRSSFSGCVEFVRQDERFFWYVICTMPMAGTHKFAVRSSESRQKCKNVKKQIKEWEASNKGSGFEACGIRYDNPCIAEVLLLPYNKRRATC